MTIKQLAKTSKIVFSKRLEHTFVFWFVNLLHFLPREKNAFLFSPTHLLIN